LPEGCYTFRIEDSYGDGICCDYGNGYYKIRASNNSVIISANGQYGNFSEQTFCIGSGGNTRGSIAEDEKIERGFEIMPNPASTYVQIETQGAKAGSTLNVVNTLGQIVSQIILTESDSRIELDLSTFENGMYIIQLDDGRKPISKKLMVFK